VPSAFFVARGDPLGDVQDATYANSKLAPGIQQHFEELDGGHMTFMVGKDTSYVGRMIDLVHKYSDWDIAEKFL